MYQYSLHTNATSQSFYRNSNIFENIAYYENYCNQKSDRSFLIFWIPRLIDHASEIFDLMPGDVIAIGAPAGVGFTRKPPTFLARATSLKSRWRRSARCVTPWSMRQRSDGLRHQEDASLDRAAIREVQGRRRFRLLELPHQVRRDLA
jgi:hypothetical protein